jgi:voltage-gated potassium channel
MTVLISAERLYRKDSFWKQLNKENTLEPIIKQHAFRRFLLSIFALIALVVIGTTGYRWLEGMGIVDAFYMTVITISTVGFGEIKPLSQQGRLFTVGLIISGGGLVAYTISGVAEFIMSGKWRAHLEHQKRLQMLEKLSDHMIVCGYGRVGRHVADELKAEGLPFIVLDPDLNKVEHIEEDGYLALAGSGSSETKLKEAGIARAKGLVAAANSDAENVFIVLTARALRPDLVIVARANFEESQSKLLRAGADRVILPYGISGRRMVTMLVRPDVADFLDEVSRAGGLELLLEQVEITPNSPLANQTMGQAQLGSQLGVTILACKLPDGQYDTRLNVDTVLQPNSQLIALGTREQLQALIKLAQEQK